jgi:hypothetical protein
MKRQPSGTLTNAKGSEIMNTTRIALIALSFTAATLGSHAAIAAEMGGKTRAQVHAELVQAQRNGDTVANHMTGATYRDLYPSQYPKEAKSTVTRAEVHAELVEAQRNGDSVANNMTGATYRDLYPSQYPKKAKSTVTRAQVQAELAAARRNGDLTANAHSGATFRDLYPSNYPTKREADASLVGMGQVSKPSQMN